MVEEGVTGPRVDLKLVRNALVVEKTEIAEERFLINKQKEVADGFLLQEEIFEPTTTVENEDNEEEEEEGEGLKLNFIPGICVKISWGGIIAC